MSVSHLFRTYARGTTDLEGDLIEGRDPDIETAYSVDEHNLWGVVLVSDIDQGDPLTDPNGWWTWWEENHLDAAKVDAMIAGLPTQARKDKAKFTKSHIPPGHAKFKKNVDVLDPTNVTWAQLKGLCSPRGSTRHDLRPEYWDAQQVHVP